MKTGSHIAYLATVLSRKRFRSNHMYDLKTDPRFKGIEKFDRKVMLSSPTMHGDEQRWVDEAIQTNWVTTAGKNINEVERQLAEYIGVKYAVALS